MPWFMGSEGEGAKRPPNTRSSVGARDTKAYVMLALFGGHYTSLL